MRVGLRCDAGPRTGVGHVVRCVALAEELTRRGVAVRFLSDLGGLPWAAQQLTGRGFAHEPAPGSPDDLLAAARRLRLDAVVLDSYELTGAYGTAVRESGRVALAIVDGDLRGQVADVYVDQNLDAEATPTPVPPGAVRLAGIRYALLRDAVRRLRPDRPRPYDEVHVPRVVCFFGGTDAYRAAPVVARLLLGSGAPFDATVIAADDGLRAELLALRPGRGSRLDVIAPTDGLPALLADADLAISASGTSTWELLCLGVPAALVWVVDNQRLGYGRTVGRGLAAGLGHLPTLAGQPPEPQGAGQPPEPQGAGQPPEAQRAGQTPQRAGQQPEAERAGQVLHQLLTDPAARAQLAERGWGAVDGRGVQRVADELLARCHATAQR